MSSEKMLKTSWAYTLKRDELITYLGEFQLDISGNVDELRRRWAKFLNAEHDEGRLKRLLEFQAKHEVTMSVSSPNLLAPPTGNLLTKSPIKKDSEFQGNELTVKNVWSPNLENRSQVIDQIRKWGLKYDGIQDPLEFIERVEELSNMYGVSLDLLPQIMPEFVCERALIWYRNNNKGWRTWKTFREDFQNFFLPPRYYERLEDEIQKRHQGVQEPFKDYVLALQNLMRHSDLKEEQKLERIFQNAHNDFKWYIRRKDFTSLGELITLAEDLENIRSTSPRNSTDHRVLVDNNTTSRPPRHGCRTCGDGGHRADRCPNRSRNTGNEFGGRQN